MAKDDLTGNMPMENLVHLFRDQKQETGVNYDLFQKAYLEAAGVFPAH